MKPERAENKNKNKKNNIERHSCFWVPCLSVSLQLCGFAVPGNDTRTQNQKKNQFNEQNMQ